MALQLKQLSLVLLFFVSLSDQVTARPHNYGRDSCSTSVTQAPDAVDVLRPVATSRPPSIIPDASGYSLPHKDDNYHTNKFYSPWYLDGRDGTVRSLPYAVNVVKGPRWGLAVQHTEEGQRFFGPENDALPDKPVQFYGSPINQEQVVIGATELVANVNLHLDSPDLFSINANLLPASADDSLGAPSLTFPVVQGMGFVTGKYRSLQPLISTSQHFTNLSDARKIGVNVYKYRLSISDGTEWLLYAVPENGIASEFTLITSDTLRGPPDWNGTVQIAKNPTGAAGEAIYDNSAGLYATSARVSATVQGKTGNYQIQWIDEGSHDNNQSLLHFALPHHVDSFDNTASTIHNLVLQTPTKGKATAVLGSLWTLVEDNLPIGMDFFPFRTNGSRITRQSYTEKNTKMIRDTALAELSTNITAAVDPSSLYFAGKTLLKYAQILFALHTVCGAPELAAPGLAELKAAFGIFASNRQPFPLVYDTDWHGIISSAAHLTGDALADFGNSYYNDHHFHYGYFIHTAALIGHMDSSWIEPNKEWVNGLVRDVSNPSSEDPFFPMLRYFDLYHGHSWAKGLFASADGKDEESSSEDVNFNYAVKMWGSVIGDTAMEGRGNLMLAILARSLQQYFLLEHDNPNHPAEFLGNKVTGILFENKVDHTTYFGKDLEEISGIHMIPFIAASGLVRTTRFIQEEWNAFFAPNASRPVQTVIDGWASILRLNQARLDPRESMSFFSSLSPGSLLLDGGTSITWGLTVAAGYDSA